MPFTVQHVKNVTIADGTNTAIVRPGDWNSAHNITYTPSGQEIIGAFSNANGISFGTSGAASAITASYTVPSVPAQTSLNFSNSNNVTFGIAGSTITASASYPAQTVDTNKAGIGYTSTTQAGTTVGATHNTQGLSMAWPPFITTAQPVGAYLTTAMASNAGSNFVSTSQSSLFQHTSATSAIVSDRAYSTHVHGMVTTTTNGSLMAVGSNSGGYTLAVPPYVTAAAGGGDGYNIIGVNGAGTALSTTIQFNNGNNVTFGLNAGTITASASYPAQTVDTNKAGTGFTSTTTAGTAITAALGTNGLTFAQPAFITTYANDLTSGRAGTGVTTAGGTGLSATLNTNGLSVSIPSWLTTAAVTNVTTNNMATAERNNYFYTSNNTFANSTHSHGNPTLNLTNLTGTTASNSAGFTISLSANSPGAAAENNWFTLGGNVAGNSSASGSTIQLIGGANITLSGLNNSQIQIIGAAGGGGGANTISTYIPYYPASTGAQTLGAQGATSASAFFWPVSIQENVNFNQIEMLMTNSNVSSATAAAGGQTITQHFGIYTINGGSALSILSSSSMSFAHTGNSGSASISFPNAYGTAGGYTTASTTASASAVAQSAWGTAGNRIVTWGFGNTMSMSPGLYIFGIHQRQTTSGFNVGMNMALGGNVMAAAQNAGPMGSYTTAYTGTGVFKWPWGIHTSTGSANYGGTKLPDSVLISAISKTMTIMPMCTIISR